MQQVIVKMPYEPDISVNHCYNRGTPRYGLKKHVNTWLTVFQGKLNNAFMDNKPDTPNIKMSIRITVPQRKGRMPDSTNFQKILMDHVAIAVGYDDWTFEGHCYPARRVEVGEQPTITVYIEW